MFSFFGESLKLWGLIRAFDPTGSGWGKISIESAAIILNRSQSSIYRLLREGRASGLFRSYGRHGGWMRIFYSSPKQLAAIAGLGSIGSILQLDISELKYLRILATDSQALHLQNQAFYVLKHDYKQDLIKASDLLTSDKLPGGIKKVGRFCLTEADFIPYGGSQQTIAARRGLSIRTVQRHLSNKYRLSSTPIREQRRAISSIQKVQILQKHPDQFRAAISQKLYPDEAPKLILYGGQYYQPRCNIYEFDLELRRKLWLRKSYQKIRKSYCSEVERQGTDLDNLDLSIEDKNQLPES